MKIVSEALDEANVDLVEKYADMIQIGARNMQNFTLLRRVGRSKLPVLLKRGMAATLEKTTKAFHDRDLYPFIYDMSGRCVAHGARPALIGKNLIDLKDQDGKYLIRELIEIAKGPGSGWVDYKWPNPLTNKIEDKSSYVEKMGDYFVGVGVYRQ